MSLGSVFWPEYAVESFKPVIRLSGVYCSYLLAPPAANPTLPMDPCDGIPACPWHWSQVMALFCDGGAGQKIISDSVSGSSVPPMAKLRSSTCGSDDRNALNDVEYLLPTFTIQLNSIEFIHWSLLRQLFSYFFTENWNTFTLSPKLLHILT